MKLDKIIDNPNIALDLDEEELVKIGAQVVDGFDQDLESRKPWEDDLERWTKLALQISDKKTYPWPNASNVKFPLLATAAMQFAARAYPSLVPSDGMVVRCQVVGYDQDGRMFTGVKPKYFPITLTNTTFSVTEAGSSYKVEAIPFNHKAFTGTYNTLFNDISIVGENVKVIDGPFNGFNGTIEKILEDKKKIEVSVLIFGRKTPMELSFMQVEKV